MMEKCKKMKSLVVWFCIAAFMFSIAVTAYGQQIPKGQDIGTLERLEERTRGQEKIKKELVEGKKGSHIEGSEGVIPVGDDSAIDDSYKVQIDTINVTGATAVSEKTINEIIYPYEGRELSLSAFREITDKITDAYRQQGNVTALAYLVPQKIENNTLEIAVAEGVVGDVTISGNEYFRTSMLERYLDLKKGDIFNYDILRQRLNFINENPDRNASVVLVKGAGRSETDVNVNVEDSFPFHATLGYSNYNSKYLGRNKYLMEIKCNNFLGMDHTASAEVQLGEENYYQLYSARYLIPISVQHKLGAYYIHLNQELGGNVKSLDIQGSGDIISLYWNWRFLNTENVTMNLSPGFIYKNIENKVLGFVLSEDNMRVGKIGIDLDMTDSFAGRTIITQEFDFGIPEFLGGLDGTDTKASRVNTGNSFFKSVTNAARIQQLPLELALMLRGALQLTPDDLTSTEQFTIGGPTTVRGYPVAEHSGDNGGTLTAEVYVPIYFLPKDWKVPFTETTVYNATKFMCFWDWGYVDTKSPGVGEKANDDLMSIGPAIRFDVPGKLAVSFDYGFGLSGKSSNGSKSRGYIEVKMFF
jgi:hemolysin activation/secretion protein